jgi:hypothetical protein
MPNPKVIVKINRAAVRELLKSKEVEADLERRARKIAAAAGPGMEVAVDQAANRARVVVYTDGIDAILAETYHQSLTRAIDAGRD